MSSITQTSIVEGQQLGDYTILRSLGHGSLGSTYLSEHRFLKKNFVLKILDASLCENRDFLSRFETEVAILSNLDHPNIVKVHNVSESDGHYFLVTDPVIDEKGTSSICTTICASAADGCRKMRSFKSRCRSHQRSTTRIKKGLSMTRLPTAV